MFHEQRALHSLLCPAGRALLANSQAHPQQMGPPGCWRWLRDPSSPIFPPASSGTVLIPSLLRHRPWQSSSCTQEGLSLPQKVPLLIIPGIRRNFVSAWHTGEGSTSWEMPVTLSWAFNSKQQQNRE